MKKRTCMTCIDFPDCKRRVRIGRKLLASGQPEEVVFEQPAQKCRSWQRHPGVEAKRAQYELLTKMIGALKKGQIFVLYTDGGTAAISVGSFPDEEVAKIATKGQSCIPIKLAWEVKD